MSETPLTGRAAQLKNEHMARAWNRLALCPDHRDKATGNCVVCQGERRERETCYETVAAIRAERDTLAAEVERLKAAVQASRSRIYPDSNYEAYLDNLLHSMAESVGDVADAGHEVDSAVMRQAHEALTQIRGIRNELRADLERIGQALAASPAPSRATTGGE